MLSHLPPSSLSDVSLISKRFRQLVTTPHAWRSAFARFFPATEALHALDSKSEQSGESDTHGERRSFTRLTPLASWRSEYVLRTRLLRCLARGRPSELAAYGRSGTSRLNAENTANAQVTYNSNLYSTITHLHAEFGTGLTKNSPRFIHGTDDLGTASTSDPRSGKVDTWGFQDSFPVRQFIDLFPGDAEYGLGAGDVVGVPNVMDVSHLFGMLYGEGHEENGVLWYRHREEKRGRALLRFVSINEAENGIPMLQDNDAICSIWIAKSSHVPELSKGLVGMLAGSSTGVLTAYSVGTNYIRDERIERGEITVRWVLSPGVPIVAIAVDSELSPTRLASRRVWAVALNALGEVFILTEMPVRPEPMTRSTSDPSSHGAQQLLEKLAWATGRSVHWALVEPTRRRARVDPFDRPEVGGNYSPRSSWNSMHLNREQIIAETKEIENFLRRKPKHFREVCHGWDMRRCMEVDFAATDEYGAGENIIVLNCGLDDGSNAEVKRYTRCRVKDPSSTSSNNSLSLADKILSGYAENGSESSPSLFGGSQLSSNIQPSWSFDETNLVQCDSTSQQNEKSNESLVEEWRTSTFTFGTVRKPQISASASDNSNHALQTASEDPLLSISGSSVASTPMSSPLGTLAGPGAASGVPGYLARLMAIGTKSGMILIYNMRAPLASSTMLENAVNPVWVICTDSPQISCIALTALYVVHGGNDGLVQAWDPLASTKDPIRTINSRFSSLARRRLIQAAASPAGVGVNLFAAGAICLDPDPTRLRGLVSLGSHLRYWSYSSIAVDQYKGDKRRLRRSERGSNQSGDKFSGTGRGALKDYIANEKLELEREKKSKRKEEARLAGRFGIDLLGPGASEDEILAYATMLSEEAAQSDELRRKSASDDSSSDTVTEQATISSTLPDAKEEVDNDMAKAIRQSLQDPGVASDVSSSSIPIRYVKKKNSPSPRTLSTLEAEIGGPSDADLDYALRLSLAEEESKVQVGKGKGREL